MSSKRTPYVFLFLYFYLCLIDSCHFQFSLGLSDNPANKKSISTADLLILREQEIAKQKYRIGIICTGILEKPEDKMKNFTALFELMDERNGEKVNLMTVRKIATISLLEVFKDVLPEYRIGQVNLKMQTGMKHVTNKCMTNC